MLRAITFDFWGTLYHNAFAREERLRMLGEALAADGQPRSWESLEAAYKHAWGVWKQVWREEQRSLPPADWLQEVLAFLDADLPPEVRPGLLHSIGKIYRASGEPRLVAGVAEVLPRLARRYRLGLISDVGLTPGRELRRVLQRDGLLPYFTAFAFSDETGAAKPHPRQFRHALDGLRVPPEEAVHIGDLPETDIAGAHNIGMKAVLFLGVNQREDGRSLADAAFSHYAELEPILERLE